MSARLRRLAAALALLAIVAVTTGCGLAENTRPQAIPRENLPPGLLDPDPGSTSTGPSETGTTVDVFLIERIGDRDRLARVERDVADARLPGERVAALLMPPTEAEVDAGLTTSIPAGTVLLAVAVDDSGEEVVVDLSAELFSIQGAELASAFAQLVWTVTEVEGVRRVSFLVDGASIRALDADGVEQEGAVTRGDYGSLAPPG